MLSFSSYAIFYAIYPELCYLLCHIPRSSAIFFLNVMLQYITLTPSYANSSYAMFSGQSWGRISGYCCSQIVSLYFQICVSSHMCFLTIYSILGYWNYPLKNIFGVRGCHIANLLGETGVLEIQLHSFIMATTRYIFLFHDDLLLRFSLTANVSWCQ